MKKFLLFFTCTLILDTALAQPVIEWAKCFGGTNSDQGWGVCEATNGQFVIVGGTSSNNGDVSGLHGGSDVWLTNITSAGNLLWQKCLGGFSSENGKSVVKTSDGGYIIVGTTNSNDGDVSGNNDPSGFTSDYWVVKTDGSGNLQWQKCLGSGGDEIGNSIKQTFDGGYIVGGISQGIGGDVSGNNGIIDFWIAKLDNSGNIQWQNNFGGSDYDWCNSIIQTADSGYLACGYTHSNDFDVTGNHGSRDCWVIKLDATGNLQWQKCFGGTSMDDLFSVIQTPDGNFIGCGAVGSNDGDVSGNHTNNYNDAWVFKFNSSGGLLWQKCLGGNNNDGGGFIQSTPDGGFVFAGASRSNDFDVSINHGLSDYWIVKIDSLANLQWQIPLGGTNNDFLNNILMLSDGSIAAIGYTSSNNIHVSGSHGNNEQWIIKIFDYYNLITGTLFGDFNSNFIHDAGEPVVTNKMVTEANTGVLGISQQNGAYRISISDSGNFSVSPVPINYYNAVPANHTAYFSGFQHTDSLNDFAFQPTGVFDDLCVSITPLAAFRAGFNANYMINYTNVGTTTLSPTVIFFPDNAVTYVSAVPVANSVTTDSVVWNFGPLAPFQTGNILVTVNVNAGTPIGTLVNSGVRIEPVTGDANTNCNYGYWEVFTTGSFDPNAILVDRDTVLITELSNPPYLDYIIYFQNTGSDTAFNARVLNNIPNDLDVASFEFVASSHPMNISYGAHARLLTFTFDNIFLPDSNVNEPMSHGFVRYRIKPKTNLIAGDSINNTAYIYFDFNVPVQTNTAVTEIVLPTSVNELSVISNQLSVFPNPAKNELTVSSKQFGEKSEIKIFDLFGRMVFQSLINNQQSLITINVSGFSTGVYFIEVSGEQSVARGKFIKE